MPRLLTQISVPGYRAFASSRYQALLLNTSLGVVV